MRLLLLLLLVMPLPQCFEQARVPAPPEAAGIADPAWDTLDTAGLKTELERTKTRERLLTATIKDRENADLAFKVYLGVGACIAAGLLLVVLGIWTTRKILAHVSQPRLLS